MREIKFRAWDSVNKFMLMDYELNYDAIKNSAASDYLWMQYTGLKDKNGKEIYEGDILKSRNTVKKIVYWCQKRAAFGENELFEPPIKHSFAKLYDAHGKNFNENGILKNHYIIGNIYENREILNSA